MDLRMRNAIYIPFPQAVPNVATIDSAACIQCRTCERMCQAAAINLDAPPEGELVELEVYAILVATGFDLFDPAVITQFGYGRYANVVTSLEFERLMCASGPTGGRILRLADGGEPRSIVFIQCVGSRSAKYRPYCSRVCCMYATKEAIITKEHDPAIGITILYNDLRAYGKGFYEYTERAKAEYEVKYVSAIPQAIEEDPLTKDLYISYENQLTQELEEQVADLVVLCPAIIPNEKSVELAKILGIELDAHGFFKAASPFEPIETGVPGIHLIGACSGPKDIPESVAEASGGALKVIHERTGAIEPKKLDELAPEQEYEEAAPRIGVFVCRCGTNIGGFLNVPEVVEYVRTLPNVVYAQDTLYTCSEDSQVVIKNAIKEHDLNRVIVASCTPRTHEPLFRATCAAGGLNQYLFEMANIREQVSWVHMNEPDLATDKAKDLIRMAIERAKYLEPQENTRTEVTPAALVIGGGIGGMTAALDVAEKGFQVYLVEKQQELGGLLNHLHRLSQESRVADQVIAPLVDRVKTQAKIQILTGSEIREVAGSLGDFQITIERQEERQTMGVGVIIVAIGAEELKPPGLYGYGENNSVQTLLEYEQRLKGGEIRATDTIAMVLCAGAREKEGITYCSAICCGNAISNAILTKETLPETEVHILYRDICVTGEDELLYRKARDLGVQFIKYSRDAKPTMVTSEGKIQLKVMNALLQQEVEIAADWLVLATPLVPPQDAEALSKFLKVPRSETGFFLEAHVKHRPLDFATDGIFLCGTCHSPKSASETIAQAHGAAARALIPLLNQVVEGDALIAEVDPEVCVGCEICALNCPYGAATLVEVEENVFKSIINPALCKGCGVCAAGCPVNAISLKNFEDVQINAMIKAGLENRDVSEPRIIVFLCNWCSYAGADNAGVSRYQYPPNVRAIRVMCSGRVAIDHMFNALLNGADGVLVTGCHLGDCHYISGSYKTERRVKLAQEMLKLAGINPKRIRLEWVSASEGNRYAAIITEFTEEIKTLMNQQK
jgi:heterodisulfide reductase subunit A